MKKNFEIIKNKIKNKFSLHKSINVILLLLLTLFSVYTFFQFKVVLFPDSQSYYRLSDILMDKLPFTEWKIVRGFGFPLIIMLWRLLFGNSQFGMQIACFTSYYSLIMICGYIIQRCIKLNKINNRFLYVILYLLLIVFNTLIIGYTHTLLTEAIMPTIFMLTVLYCLKWYKTSFEKNKKTTIILNIIFIFNTILIWFIKQPYIPAYFMALFLTTIISAIYFKSFKILLKKSITIFLCLLFLIISIFSWNKFMSNYSIRDVNDLNSSFMSGNILSGLNVYYEKVDQEIYCNSKYLKKLKVTKNETQKINKFIKEKGKKWCDYIDIYTVKDENKKIIDHEIVMKNKNKVSLLENGLFLVKNIFKHPILTTKSYFYNYLAIADIQERDFSKGYSSSLKFSSYAGGENMSNGIWALYDDRTLVINDIEEFEHLNGTTNVSNKGLRELLLTNLALCQYLYKILVLLALPIFIFGFYKYIKTKNESYFVVCLCSLMCFVDAMFNVIYGAIIDRYVYPLYPGMILCLLILLMDRKESENDEKKYGNRR